MHLLNLLLPYGIYYFMIIYIVRQIIDITTICLLLYFIMTYKIT